MQKVSPCLWFDDEAEEASNFYVSIFRNSRIVETTRYVEGSPRPKGSVMTVRFILDGHEFLALNGGPHFSFSPAISFVVHCESQEEVDGFWEKLSAGGEEQQCGWLTELVLEPSALLLFSAGGEEQQCGWLKDKFGVSWQIVPKALIAMLSGGDAVASQRAVAAMLQMNKLDISLLERAYRNA